MAKYGVFIIESLRSDDYFDGENLHEILKLSLIASKYHWVDTYDEFVNRLEDFKKSNFRYLHISCHADRTGIEINGQEISYGKLASLLKGKVMGKRLFLSACKASNIDIAAKILIRNLATSLIGTPIDLDFDKAALFWPSFYHVMHENNFEKMDSSNIKKTLKRCVELFGIPINYYTRLRGGNQKIRRYKFRKGERTDNREILVKIKQIHIDARSNIKRKI
jgi:hypothetical protein